MTLLDHSADRSTPSAATGDGLLASIGRASGRHPRRVLLVWALVVLVAAPLAVTLTSALSGAGWEAQGSTAQEVRDELRRDFPQLGAEAAIVAYRQDTPIADDPTGLQQLVTGLQGSPGTTSVIDPLAQPAVLEHDRLPAAAAVGVDQLAPLLHGEIGRAHV